MAFLLSLQHKNTMSQTLMKKLLRTAACVTALLTSAFLPSTAKTPADSISMKAETPPRHPAAYDVKRTANAKTDIYDLPYSERLSRPDWNRMWLNTGVLFAGGVTTLGVLQLLPEGATAWNKERVTSRPFWKRWSYHVRSGPVWDGDNFVFNYILHPYAGAVYYMAARSLGFNRMGSFLYCTAISTVFWEYGIEAFMEKPSIQDLILTPLSGFIIGEMFYKLKRKIVSDGYRLWDSRTWGNIVAFIIDPVNEVIGLFAGNPCREGVRRIETLKVSSTPWASPLDGGAFGLTVNINL